MGGAPGITPHPSLPTCRSHAKVLGTATLHLFQISSAGAELQGEQGPTLGGVPSTPSPSLNPPFFAPRGGLWLLTLLWTQLPPLLRPPVGSCQDTQHPQRECSRGKTAPILGRGHQPPAVPPPFILQDTGVAYRGRVLLELSTHTRSPDGRQQDTIASEDVARVQVGTRHRATAGAFSF